MSAYVYKMSPLFKDKIWGGRNLERMYNKPLPAGLLIGESWELADLVEGESAVANGRRAGQTLNQLVREEGKSLIGESPLQPNGRFPLLLKLLDANDTLSLQVHPDEDAARRIPGAALKTECWYILESRGGYIYKGLKPGVTAQTFRAALANDDVTELLQRYDVQAGDFYYLPAGTVHALGAGVVVAEVQTPSDTTYRVSDWGRGREIHVERAMECIHFVPDTNDAPGAGGECLLKTPYFHVYHRSARPGMHPVAQGRCVSWMILHGEGNVRCDSHDGAVSFLAGDTLLLPAGARDVTVTVTQPADWLETTLPPF